MVGELVHAVPVQHSVELRAQKNAERADVEPDQGGDSGGKGSVDPRVVGDAGDVEAVSQGCRKPDEGSGEGAGQHPLPFLAAPGSEMVERREYGEDGKEGDRP